MILVDILSFSQNNNIEYYTKDWKKTESKGFYKREINKINDTLFELKDFIGNKLEMTGFLSSMNPFIENGIFKFYDKKGNLYRQVEYINGELFGEMILFSKGIQTEKVDYNFSYEVDDNNLPTENLDKVDSEMANNMPTFKGGDVELRMYIALNTIYPPLAKKYNKKGQVLVAFTIDDNGQISDIRIVKSVYKELDKEAIRVIKNCPSWNPPKIVDNKPCKITIPINFEM